MSAIRAGVVTAVLNCTGVRFWGLTDATLFIRNSVRPPWVRLSTNGAEELMVVASESMAEVSWGVDRREGAGDRLADGARLLGGDFFGKDFFVRSMISNRRSISSKCVWSCCKSLLGSWISF